MLQRVIRMWLVLRPISFANNNAQTPHEDGRGASRHQLRITLKHNLSLLIEGVCYCPDTAFRCVPWVSTK